MAAANGFGSFDRNVAVTLDGEGLAGADIWRNDIDGARPALTVAGKATYDGILAVNIAGAGEFKELKLTSHASSTGEFDEVILAGLDEDLSAQALTVDDLAID